MSLAVFHESKTYSVFPFGSGKALKRVPHDVRSRERLPAEKLHKATAEHIWHAVQFLCESPTEHNFGPSTDFDLIAPNDDRLPPKAVFGLAATEALGFTVQPRHFSGG